MRPVRHVTRCSLAAGLMLLAACGAGSVGGTEPTPPGEVSAFQARIVQDGVISPDEYEGAIDGMIACLRQAGIAAIGPFPGFQDGFWVYNVPTGSHSLSAYRQCEDRYVSIVEAQYFRQSIPTGDALEEGIASLAGCLSSAGLPDLTPDSPPGDFGRRFFVDGADLTEQQSDCFRRHLSVLYADQPFMVRGE